jgi:hypothetical protein
MSNSTPTPTKIESPTKIIFSFVAGLILTDFLKNASDSLDRSLSNLFPIFLGGFWIFYIIYGTIVWLVFSENYPSQIDKEIKKEKSNYIYFVSIFWRAIDFASLIFIYNIANIFKIKENTDNINLYSPDKLGMLSRDLCFICLLWFTWKILQAFITKIVQKKHQEIKIFNRITNRKKIVEDFKYTRLLLSAFFFFISIPIFRGLEIFYKMLSSSLVSNIPAIAVIFISSLLFVVLLVWLHRKPHDPFFFSGFFFVCTTLLLSLVDIWLHDWEGVKILILLSVVTYIHVRCDFLYNKKYYELIIDKIPIVDSLNPPNNTTKTSDAGNDATQTPNAGS